uniref:long-chain-fatty-acid--CoA ligase n=1 Tax=Denticeps clupeoides TaxID=299321 RepID=A0AAY4DJL7_9TELE
MYVWTRNMFATSAILAAALVAPLLLLLRIFWPYFWKDVRLAANLLRVLLTFAARRRRKPAYLVLDRFLEQAARHADRPFVVFEGATYSYRDADRQSNRIANALRSRCALTQGRTAALFLGNEPAFLFAWLALAKLGCAAALLNCNIRSKSLLHCFGCCGAKVLIAAAELADAVGEIKTSLEREGVTVLVLTRECNTPGFVSFLGDVENASEAPVPRSLRSEVTFRSPAVYIYTSGTTGLPKAAVVNNTRLLAALAVLSSNGVTAEDSVYLNLPLYHTAGFFIGFIGSIEIGSTIILRRKFSASQFWDDCRRHNVTVVQYIGEILRYLCNSPKKDNDKDHKVRLAIGNGLRADVWKEFLNRFGDIEIREFYASTEGNIGFMNDTGKIGAIGRTNFLHKLFPYALIKYDTEVDAPVRDSSGLCIEVGRGETGLLVSKITDIAPFEGYARNKEQTEKKKVCDVSKKGDVYFNSGDLMRIDEDNFIYFQDRVGDTFRWKGENVATTEVSDILTMMEFVEEANVYGVQVPGHEGKIGMAAITIKEDEEPDWESMFSHISSYLPAYAHPRFIRIQNSVEVTATFKQMKVKLVEAGFNPSMVCDPLFFLNDKAKTYIPMTEDIYNSIVSGTIKL